MSHRKQRRRAWGWLAAAVILGAFALVSHFFMLVCPGVAIGYGAIAFPCQDVPFDAGANGCRVDWIGHSGQWLVRLKFSLAPLWFVTGYSIPLVSPAIACGWISRYLGQRSARHAAGACSKCGRALRAESERCSACAATTADV